MVSSFTVKNQTIECLLSAQFSISKLIRFITMRRDFNDSVEFILRNISWPSFDTSLIGQRLYYVLIVKCPTRCLSGCLNVRLFTNLPAMSTTIAFK